MDDFLARNAFLASGNVDYWVKKLNIPRATLITRMQNVTNSTSTTGLKKKHKMKSYTDALTSTSKYSDPTVGFTHNNIITLPSLLKLENI
jgi:hypothetical protein